MTDTAKAPKLPPLILGGSLWAIRADALPRIMDFARAAVRGDLRSPAAFLDDEITVAPQTPAPAGVAVLPLTGVLTPHGSMLSWLFGGSAGGVQGFRDSLARAVADPDVSAIVLDVDSPGGSVGLVPEAAADVRAARDVKPVIAVASTLAASGAYWIASQASELHVTPSGQVGSIGVYYVHEDWSRANDRAGLQVTYISSGRYKTEGNPDEPLGEATREAWQQDSDALYRMFVEDVATGRGTSADAVREGYGEGRVLLAEDALAAGMVDGISTFQQIVARTLSAAAPGGARAVMPAARAESPAPGPAPDAPAPEMPTDSAPAEESAPLDVPLDDQPEKPETPSDEPSPDEAPPEMSAREVAFRLGLISAGLSA